MLRCVALWGFACLMGCTSRPTNIAVVFSELPPDVDSVEITVQLNHQAATDPARTRSDVGRFFIELNQSAGGLLRLDAQGFAADRCLIAEGTTQAMVDPATFIELALPIRLKQD